MDLQWANTDLMGKQNLYECSVRMPLLIAGPGIHARKRVDELVYQHSMYATTCELAGHPTPVNRTIPQLRAAAAWQRSSRFTMPSSAIT